MSSPTTDKKQVPVMEGIFTWPSESPRLIGSKCKKCGTVFFPVTFRCHDPECRGEEVEEIEISPRGKLWSYTINYYPLPPPFKPPQEFKPFGVGEVEFPEGVRVAGVIVDCDPEKDLKIDMEMEILFGKYYDDDDGNEVHECLLKK